MNSFVIKYKFVLPLSIFIFVSLGQAEDISVAPVDIQAALALKLLAFNEKLASSENVNVYCMNSTEFAKNLKNGIGKQVGSSKLSSVVEGDGVPAEKPSVIYIGNSSKLDDILSYSRANGVLTITGDPALIAKGVSLGIGIINDKPKVLLNLSSSKLESITWNPAILKIAITNY